MILEYQDCPPRSAISFAILSTSRATLDLGALRGRCFVNSRVFGP